MRISTFRGTASSALIALSGLLFISAYAYGQSTLVNISTRGEVLTGSDVMIAGFVIQGSASQKVVVTVSGPSLVNYGITNPLADPTLTLVRSSDQAVLATNDNWQAQANSSDVAAIQASGFQPSNLLEPAIIATLAPGAYTAIVSGVGGDTGVAVVGVYAVGASTSTAPPSAAGNWAGTASSLWIDWLMSLSQDSSGHVSGSLACSSQWAQRGPYTITGSIDSTGHLLLSYTDTSYSCFTTVTATVSNGKMSGTSHSSCALGSCFTQNGSSGGTLTGSLQ